MAPLGSRHKDRAFEIARSARGTIRTFDPRIRRPESPPGHGFVVSRLQRCPRGLATRMLGVTER